jgi:hypothetical protein
MRPVSTGPATFRESDLTRALKAAKKAGVRVRVDIEPGKMRVTMIDEDEAKQAATSNEWDDVLK